MWVPRKLVEILSFAKDDLSALRAENTLLKTQLVVAQTNFDWARHRLNTLEFENKALMEKAFNIKVPSPEIVRPAKPDPTFDPKNFSFEDVGEDLARKLGLPSFDANTTN